MTRVDFYLLPDAAPEGRALLACRLAEKAWSLGHPVYLHTPSAAAARALDQLLWTFRQGSFLPHALVQDALPPTPPILIGDERGPGAAGLDPPCLARMHTLLRSDGPSAPATPPWDGPPGPGPVLINLDREVPGFFEGFARVAELLDPSEEGLHSGRARFAFYRSRGIAPEYHKLAPGKTL